MRAFTKNTPPPGAERKQTSTARPAGAHNVGQGCTSCSGSGQCGSGGPCVCTQVPPWWNPGWGQWPPPGFPGGNFTAPTPPTVPPGTTVPSTPPPVPMVLPPDYARPGNLDMGAWQQYAGRGFGALACVPYVDAIRDCLFMNTVASPLTAVGIGATENVDVQPPSGWFDAYYIDVTAYIADGIAVGPNGFNMTIPTVVGCPTNACDTGLPINRAFFDAADACCCGRPFRAIIPNAAQGTPLRTAVTNLGPAAMTVQVVVRGFCHSTRICV